jgi:hypothetical protein
MKGFIAIDKTGCDVTATRKESGKTEVKKQRHLCKRSFI